MASTEPEWSEDDRGWVQALLSIQQAACPGCGGDLQETTRNDPDEGYDVTQVACKRCQSLDLTRTAYHQKHKDKDGHSDVHNRVWSAVLVHRRT